MTDMLELAENPLAPPVGEFRIDGALIEFSELRQGHIHDTWVSVWEVAGTTVRFVHQRINRSVFDDVSALMHNVESLSDHVHARARDRPDAPIAIPELIRTRGGNAYFDGASGAWRTFRFIDGVGAGEAIAEPREAHNVAAAYGLFQRAALGLRQDQLRPVIPHFFDATARLDQLKGAVARDPVNRASSVQAELQYIDSKLHELQLPGALMRENLIPPRIVHGDSKSNNVLLDVASGAPAGVLDLDTFGASWALHDIGDMLRYHGSTAAEDERETAQVSIDMETCQALIDGYLSEATFLTKRERQLIALAAQHTALTIGVRFLADYVVGDLYFKTIHHEQNLDRARNQLRLAAEFEKAAPELAPKLSIQVPAPNAGSQDAAIRQRAVSHAEKHLGRGGWGQLAEGVVDWLLRNTRRPLTRPEMARLSGKLGVPPDDVAVVVEVLSRARPPLLIQVFEDADSRIPLSATELQKLLRGACEDSQTDALDSLRGVRVIWRLAGGLPVAGEESR